jgi:hypothetical protein
MGFHDFHDSDARTSERCQEGSKTAIRIAEQQMAEMALEAEVASSSKGD